MENKILYYRKLKKLSQAKLAESAGISRTHLNRIESGIVDPSLSVANSIAKALGKQISEIFCN